MVKPGACSCLGWDVMQSSTNISTFQKKIPNPSSEWQRWRRVQQISLKYWYIFTIHVITSWNTVISIYRNGRTLKNLTSPSLLLLTLLNSTLSIHHHELRQLQNTVISVYNKLLQDKKFRKSKIYWALTAHVPGVTLCRRASASKDHGAFIRKDQASREKMLGTTHPITQHHI
jgi:hypothetical protein